MQSVICKGVNFAQFDYFQKKKRFDTNTKNATWARVDIDFEEEKDRVSSPQSLKI